MSLRIVLINPYELGRQSFGIAHAAAQLRAAGHSVRCADLSRERLADVPLGDADLIVVQLAMHTATRIAAEALPRIRAAAPRARLCAYGLYAPFNADWLHAAGVESVLGGEFEPALLALAARIDSGEAPAREMLISTGKVPFAVPSRADMGPLVEHARLREADGTEVTMAFAEASRGCKHLCRHCPVVPVYGGRFRIVPVDIVMADLRQQVDAGARHVSFGDPDFLNGPTHALRVARALHAEFPHVTFDAVIKIEHILGHPDVLAELGACGLRFVISAVESVDDAILERLDKGHTRADFEAAVQLMEKLAIPLAPTFVAFTPWTTLAGYVDLLEKLVALDLIDSVPPVQLAIRLLIPAASRLLELDEVRAIAGDFDEARLGHPWQHPDPRVDTLQQAVERYVGAAEALPRREVFEHIRGLAHAAAGSVALPLPATAQKHLPHHTENWYCCAEPTSAQLAAY